MTARGKGKRLSLAERWRRRGFPAMLRSRQGALDSTVIASRRVGQIRLFTALSAAALVLWLLIPPASAETTRLPRPRPTQAEPPTAKEAPADSKAAAAAADPSAAPLPRPRPGTDQAPSPDQAATQNPDQAPAEATGVVTPTQADATEALPTDEAATPPADTGEAPAADKATTPPSDTGEAPAAAATETPPADTGETSPADTVETSPADTAGTPASDAATSAEFSGNGANAGSGRVVDRRTEFYAACRQQCTAAPPAPGAQHRGCRAAACHAILWFRS